MLKLWTLVHLGSLHGSVLNVEIKLGEVMIWLFGEMWRKIRTAPLKPAVECSLSTNSKRRLSQTDRNRLSSCHCAPTIPHARRRSDNHPAFCISNSTSVYSSSKPHLPPHPSTSPYGGCCASLTQRFDFSNSQTAYVKAVCCPRHSIDPVKVTPRLTSLRRKPL